MNDVTLPPDLDGPALPAPYVGQLVELGQAWGLEDGVILAGTRIGADLLRRPDARIPIRDCVMVVLNLLNQGNRPGLGIEAGLHLKLTAHGSLGYAVMSVPTLRHAARLAARYVRMRWGGIEFELTEEPEAARLRLVDRIDLGPFRRSVHEVLLVLLWQHACFLTGVASRDCRLDFVDEEPDYFAAYREQLPPVRWGQPHSEIRFASHYLDLPLTLADPLAAQRAIEQVDREMAAVSEQPESIVARVRGELHVGEDGFPTLEQVAGRLHVSERTLSRRLKEAGSSFRLLLEQARHREALRLMDNPELALQDIASLLGYRDPPSFTHAFRRWTGATPSQYRARHASRR